MDFCCHVQSLILDPTSNVWDLILDVSLPISASNLGELWMSRSYILIIFIPSECFVHLLVRSRKGTHYVPKYPIWKYNLKKYMYIVKDKM